MINFGMLTQPFTLSQLSARDVRLSRMGIAGTRQMDQQALAMTPTTASGAPINRAARTLIELAGPNADYDTNYMASLARAYQRTPEFMQGRQANFFQNAAVLPEEQYQSTYGQMTPEQIAQYEYDVAQQPEYIPIQPGGGGGYMQPQQPMPLQQEPMQMGQQQSFAQGYNPNQTMTTMPTQQMPYFMRYSQQTWI